jgi:hypothetical protein
MGLNLTKRVVYHHHGKQKIHAKATSKEKCGHKSPHLAFENFWEI